MSKIWPNASKQAPCKVCGKEDWCSFGDWAMVCRRVESKFPHYDHGGSLDGWYHGYDGQKPTYVPPPKKPARQINVGNLIEKLFASDKQIELLAIQLGVSKESLRALGFVWSEISKAWAIPMFNGEGNPIGIQLRGEQKKCVTGSQLGLFIPKVESADEAFLPEGGSDVAAFLTCGLFAIGRPSSNSGGEMLRVAIKRLGIKRVIIVVDNDSLKKAPNGREWRPGRDGAEKLQKEMKVPSCLWIIPAPVKDFRALLNKVGVQSARAIATSSIAQKIWRTF